MNRRLRGKEPSVGIAQVGVTNQKCLLPGPYDRI